MKWSKLKITNSCEKLTILTVRFYLSTRLWYIMRNLNESGNSQENFRIEGNLTIRQCLHLLSLMTKLEQICFGEKTVL